MSDKVLTFKVPHWRNSTLLLQTCFSKKRFNMWKLKLTKLFYFQSFFLCACWKTLERICKGFHFGNNQGLWLLSCRFGNFIKTFTFGSLLKIKIDSKVQSVLVSQYATFHVNPSRVPGFFLYPLKTSENLWVFYVFRGYRKRPVVFNGLITIKQVNHW